MITNYSKQIGASFIDRNILFNYLSKVDHQLKIGTGSKIFNSKTKNATVKK